MYLRFLQLKRSGNVKLRNKMKKGKAGWFVVSMCFFSAGLVFMGNPASVHADETGVNNPQIESVAQQNSDDKVVPEQQTNNEQVGTVNTVIQENKGSVTEPEQPVNNSLTNDGQLSDIPIESKMNNRALFQAQAQTTQKQGSPAIQEGNNQTESDGY